MPQLTLAQANQQVIEFIRAGKLAEAESLARQILQHKPDDAVANHNLGLIAQRVRRHHDAIEMIRRAIAIDPAAAEFHSNLGLSLRATGQLEESAAAFRGAIRLRPELGTAHLNLGVVLYEQGNAAAAESEFRQSIRITPNEPWPYLNLGKALRTQDKMDEAEAVFRHAIALAPEQPHGYNMLGSCLREGGRIEEAVASFRKAVSLNPDLREAHSNLCYALYFDPQTSPAEILQEHRRWSAHFAEPLNGFIRPHDSDRSPDRRLRIGYLSPNLRTHVVGFFMEPILEHHDRGQFEIICYNDATQMDALAAKFKGQVNLWRDTAGMRDEQLAQLIRSDRIDILVDLTLHMRGCRLRVYAQKPAPVQITHLAYCGTSGLETMEWCITDPHMCVPGTEQYFTEKMLPLPECYWCYRPSASAPGVGPLPAARNGYITFGSLNTLAKVNNGVLKVWSRLLQSVPKSRLAVHVPGGAETRSVFDRFVRHGIPQDRLVMLPRRSRDEYLDLYNQIDVALDPFPYGGGTTTFDALWMGVPLVTLAGELPLARAGATILTNLAITDLIAQSPERYIEIAADLARNIDRLNGLRQTLRGRLRDSVLLNEPQYVRHLEAVYRQAWRQWCLTPTPSRQTPAS